MGGRAVRRRSAVTAGILALTLLAGCASDGGDGPQPLGAVTPAAPATSISVAAPARTKRVEQLRAARTWMYQLQDVTAPGSLETLAASAYDMLVVEPGDTFKDGPTDAAQTARVLRRKPGGGPRLVLAYIDIGEAEDYRSYWLDSWRAPTAARRGDPTFLITIDPDGWSGNYPVAYWEPAWQGLWLGTKGIVATLARDGYDGIYLDWVEAYDDEKVAAEAQRQGRDAKVEMIRFVEALRAAGRAVTADFLVVAQNAPYLIDTDPARYTKAIDALAVEDTWFHGEGDAEWDDPKAGDQRARHEGDDSTENRIEKYREYSARGLPVFSVDYCVRPENAAAVYRDALAAGLRPLVTRVSLSRMTTTPPPGLGPG